MRFFFYILETVVYKGPEKEKEKKPLILSYLFKELVFPTFYNRNGIVLQFYALLFTWPNIRALTPSLPGCHLKTTNKAAKFETLKPFCFIFRTGIP